MGNEMRPFQRLQHAFAASIRDPENNPQPKGLPAQRIRDLSAIGLQQPRVVPCRGFRFSKPHWAQKHGRR